MHSPLAPVVVAAVMALTVSACTSGGEPAPVATEGVAPSSTASAFTSRPGPRVTTEASTATVAPTTPAAASPKPTATATATPTVTASPAPAPGAEGPYDVVEVVDGDTLKIDRDGERVNLRLIGVDTPETRHPSVPDECYGAEATQAMKDLVADGQVWTVSDPTQDQEDRYGRALVYVHTEDGTMVNHKLIEEGAGIEYTYRGSVYQQQAKFREAQARAEAEGRGLWSEATCSGDADLPLVAPSPSEAALVEESPEPDVAVREPEPQRAPTTREPEPVVPAEPKQDEPESADPGASYKNCDAARAAGVAPILEGEPGYAPRLDRNDDGVACEE